MPQTRPPYVPGFRRQMIELVRAGRDPADLARDFDRPPRRTATGLRRPIGRKADER